MVADTSSYRVSMPTTPGVLTARLEETWDAIRAEVGELPHARIALLSTPPSSNHGPERWMTADGVLVGLAVTTSTLEDGAEETVRCLLHEAAHVLCWLRDVKDTTMRGAYHNARYMAAADEVGLFWPEDRERIAGRGYLNPELRSTTRERYATYIDALRPAIDQTLPYLRTPEPVRSSRPNRLTIQCECDPPRKARMSPTVFELGPVVCGVCGAAFAVTDGDS